MKIHIYIAAIALLGNINIANAGYWGLDWVDDEPPTYSCG